MKNPCPRKGRQAEDGKEKENKKKKAAWGDRPYNENGGVDTRGG